jgi:capsular exopolysaccharide synthesis family protein
MDAHEPRPSFRPTPEHHQVTPHGLKGVLAVLRRRRSLFLGTMLLVMSIAGAVILGLTPHYKARATLMIDARERRVVDIASVVSELVADDQAIASELQVIRSDELVGRVIRQLELDRRAEFNPKLRTGYVQMLADWVGSRWLSVWAGEVAPPAGDGQGADAIPADIVVNVQRGLDVKPLGRSRVIAIDFSSEDAVLAARVPNALAEAYTDFQLEQKLAATRQAASWLEDRLSELRRRARSSEQAVADYRTHLFTSEGRTTDMLQQEVADTTSQLTHARIELEEAETRLDLIRTRVDGGQPTAVFDVVDPQVMIWLNDQITSLRQTEAQLRASHGPDHPVVRDVQQQIRSVAEGVAARLIAGAANHAGIAAAKVRRLETQLGALLTDAIAFEGANVTLHALEREAEADAALFRTFLTRAKETEQMGAERPDAWVVSYAARPVQPAFPSRLALLGLAFVVAGFAGTGSVLLAETLERGFRSSADVAHGLRLNVLATIPESGRRARRRPPPELVGPGMRGAMAEAFRSLYTGLALLPANGTARPQILLVTSSVPAEGKTTTVAALARVIAGTGARVAAVDADLRASALHGALGIDNGRGLIEYLAGEATLEEITRRDERSGATVVTAGRGARDPLELLRGERLPSLLDRLKSSHDFVLVDSPPLLAVSDARLLVELVDVSLLVVRWRTTPREAATSAVASLRESATPIAGAILSQVPEPQVGAYGYGYGGYGYGYRS